MSLNQLNQWAFETPLEQVPEGVTLDPRVIEINGMKWQARSDCVYKNDYYSFIEAIERWEKMPPEWKKKNRTCNEWNLWRNTIQTDLFFFVFFVMKNPLANHPFIIQACLEIEEEKGDSLEVWARDHLKTTIISVGRQCQKVLNDPERRIGIFSATRPLAVKIQSVIKELFESKFLINCFPDILWEDPYKDAPKWSEAPEGGLIVKRAGFYKEPTISSWGLIEGTPTGYHLTDIICDDIVTIDTLSPDVMQKVCDNFDMAENLGSRDRQITVVGTFYRHDDPLHYIMNKKDPLTDLPMFKTRKKPATVDGSFAGAAIFLPERTLAKKRAGNIYFFFCQQLLDATPRGFQKLNYKNLITVSRKELPGVLYKFMFIDGSGDAGRRQDRAADAWAFGVVGVEPFKDDKGASRLFILDLIIEEMDLIKAQETAVEMYCRNGRIQKLGIEKVGMSTTEIHICAALRAKKRFLSIERKNLEILKPAGRKKEFRIESALSIPLNNARIHILDSIQAAYVERLKLEMEKFPAWHDDGIDGLSYVYDMIKNYHFPDFPVDIRPESTYDAAFRKANEKKSGGWIAV